MIWGVSILATSHAAKPFVEHRGFFPLSLAAKIKHQKEQLEEARFSGYFRQFGKGWVAETMAVLSVMLSFQRFRHSVTVDISKDLLYENTQIEVLVKIGNNALQ